MSQTVQSEFDVAVSAAREAGDILLSYFRASVNVREKGIADLVTDADVAAERCIAARISAAYPGHAILGEEEQAGDTDAEYLWVVDPLDGTTNFAHGLPHFAVSIALLHRGQPQLGVVWNPARGDLYTAQLGAGAYHNGRRLQVNSEATMDQSLIGTGFYYDRGAMMEATLGAIGDCFRQNIHGIRRFGTAALDLAHVADGLYGAFFEFQLSPWDFAAGQLLVTEAGGRVTDCSGNPLPLRKSTILASNGLLHDQMLSIVRPRVGTW
ncbi:MAG TPA: inositol monophosphatase [Planctomycetaceae bacterium]|nr:inositol monophosphatase [Planctomycetaceae bacterium]HBC60944.1 inositol monophosphatase [Planctomycetaceae bacterium]